jgi:hypothetical protein
MNIVDYIEALKKINVHKAIVETFRETSEVLVAMNKQQLSEGKRSDDEKIHWLKDGHYPYTKPYARFKSAQGLQTKVVDLKLRGDFYESIGAKVNEKDIEFNGSSEIAKYLEENYSANIYSVTDENTEKYIDQNFTPVFIQKIEDQSGLSL